MSYYLLDNRPRRSQFRTSRRAKPTGCIVVHTTEGSPDTSGPDTGAENCARFVRDRSDAGSYHALCDSDSRINMIPWGYEAYHDGSGSNPWSIGISVATQASRWAGLPQSWKEAAVVNLALLAADAATWLRSEHGITVPARRISKAESDRGLPGFLGHGERDPGRRSDPGKDFLWHLFLTAFSSNFNANLMPATYAPEASPWTGVLLPGQYIISGNQRFMLIHQTDGNVVLYDWGSGGGVAIWASHTQGQGSDLLVLQGDGNLVLYGAGKALWASGTDGHPGCGLVLQNDGNCVMYAPGARPVWATNTRR